MKASSTRPGGTGHVDTSASRSPTSPETATAADLLWRSSSSSPPPRRNSISLSQVDAGVNEASRLLDAGGLDMLRQGAQDGFARLPAPYRALAWQTARLVGVMSQPTPSATHLPFPALAQRLDAVHPRHRNSSMPAGWTSLARCIRTPANAQRRWHRTWHS